jgi:hypothetical protein
MRAAMVGLVVTVGCVAHRPTSAPVASDTPQECGRICEGMGLQLSAVVVIRSSTGCVCEAQPAAGRSAAGGAANAAGAVIAVMEEEQQQEQHRYKPPEPSQ